MVVISGSGAVAFRAMPGREHPAGCFQVGTHAQTRAATDDGDGMTRTQRVTGDALRCDAVVSRALARARLILCHELAHVVDSVGAHFAAATRPGHKRRVAVVSDTKRRLRHSRPQQEGLDLVQNGLCE